MQRLHLCLTYLRATNRARKGPDFRAGTPLPARPGAHSPAPYGPRRAGVTCRSGRPPRAPSPEEARAGKGVGRLPVSVFVPMALWRGSAFAGLLALAVGCVFLLEPQLPSSALRLLWSSLPLGPASPGLGSPEGRLAAAWDALIVRPVRRWRRVAVG